MRDIYRISTVEISRWIEQAGFDDVCPPFFDSSAHDCPTEGGDPVSCYDCWKGWFKDHQVKDEDEK